MVDGQTLGLAPTHQAFHVDSLHLLSHSYRPAVGMLLGIGVELTPAFDQDRA